MYIREGIGLLLLLVGLLRASVLVTHDPVVGYAPQSDMSRVAACSNLLPDTGPKAAPAPVPTPPAGAAPAPGAQPAAPAPAPAQPAAPNVEVHGPFAFYRLGDTAKADCYPSTEVVLDSVVLSLTRPAQTEGHGIRVHWMGYAKLLLLALTAFILAWALHHEQGASLAHGILMLVVLTDPVVTLWFNTFATEFFVIWGLYAVIGAASALAIAERGAIGLWVLLIVGTIALAFSREQYAFLPPVLVGIAAPWLWYRSAPMTATVFFVAVVSAAVSFAALQRSPPPLQAGAQSIASVFALPRAVPIDPIAFAEQAARSMPSLQPLTIDAGALEAPEKTPAADLPWWAWSPLAAISAREPMPVARAVSLGALLIGPLALLVALLWARPASQNIGSPMLFGMLLGGAALYGFVTAAFAGTPSARNFLPTAIAIWALNVAILVSLPFLAIRWAMAGKTGWKEMALGLSAALLFLGAYVVALDFIAKRVQG